MNNLPSFFINNDMQSFQTFFYESSVNPHHRRSSRLTKNRTNLIANRYKKGDPNYRTKINVGPIGSVKLKEYIDEYNLSIPELNNNPEGVRLRKLPYKIVKTQTGFVVKKINQK